jgi:hypothetical protein
MKFLSVLELENNTKFRELRNLTNSFGELYIRNTSTEFIQCINFSLLTRIRFSDISYNSFNERIFNFIETAILKYPSLGYLNLRNTQIIYSSIFFSHKFKFFRLDLSFNKLIFYPETFFLENNSGLNTLELGDTQLSNSDLDMYFKF